MRGKFAYAACSMIALAAGSSPALAGVDAYIGEVIPGGQNFCPRGTAPANGQLLSISQNTALFALIGTIYGGNGQTTFALPDLRGRAPLHNGQGPGLVNRSIGEQSGTETNTLLTTQMAPHNHAATFNVNNTATADSGNPTGNVVANSAVPAYKAGVTPTPGAAMAAQTATVGVTGQNTPVNNMAPYLGVQYCVVLEGIFPPRN